MREVFFLFLLKEETCCFVVGGTILLLDLPLHTEDEFVEETDFSALVWFPKLFRREAFCQGA